MKRGQLALHPVVLWIRISRDVLARLQTLAFVRGDYGADEYWSFVQHCRASVPAAPSLPAVVRHHERGGTGVPSWYDMVSGPVAAFWQQRNAMSEADQFSFHTDAAQSAINDVLAGRRGTDYDVINVPF